MSPADEIERTELPITDAFLREKRLQQERGELALIEDGLAFHHLAYFSLLAGMGYRGGHYHARKTERFYVISGVLQIELVAIDCAKQDTIRVEAGTKIAVSPRIAHRFSALEDAQVLEYYEGFYHADDDHPYPFDKR